MRRTRIEVDRPCVKPGVTFEERDGGRFCLSCREMQHDLRDATLSEALALFDANGGRLCGTFRTGPSGELRFKPDPPSRAGRAARGAALALALAGCGSESTPADPAPVVTTAAPPSSAPPTSVAEAPPSTVAEPPPTTTAPPPDVLSSATHATDASTDASHHAGHWHTHAQVGVAGHQISGGATAYQPPQEGPSGTVRFEPLAMQSAGPGTFDTSQLVRMIHMRQAALRNCYLRVLRNDPTIAGDLTCSLTIDATGAVSATSVVNDTTGASPLSQCAVVVLRSMRFEVAPEGGDVTYTVPFHFESQDSL
jgi:TonB family protein